MVGSEVPASHVVTWYNYTSRIIDWILGGRGIIGSKVFRKIFLSVINRNGLHLVPNRSDLQLLENGSDRSWLCTCEPVGR